MRDDRLRAMKQWLPEMLRCGVRTLQDQGVHGELEFAVAAEYFDSVVWVGASNLEGPRTHTSPLGFQMCRTGGDPYLEEFYLL